MKKKSFFLLKKTKIENIGYSFNKIDIKKIKNFINILIFIIKQNNNKNIIISTLSLSINKRLEVDKTANKKINLFL